MSKELLETIQQQLEATELIAESYVKTEMTRFVFKWGLIAVLYAILIPRFPWIRYTLLIALPVAAYLLYKIFSQKKKLDTQVSDIRKTIEDIRVEMPEQLSENS